MEAVFVGLIKQPQESQCKNNSKESVSKPKVQEKKQEKEVLVVAPDGEVYDDLWSV